MNDIKDATLTPETRRLHQGLEEIWYNPRGWRALTIVNHTTVGLRFMVTGGIFFLIGGLLAMLIRAQLAFPGNEFLSNRKSTRLNSSHVRISYAVFCLKKKNRK